MVSKFIYNQSRCDRNDMTIVYVIRNSFIAIKIIYP